MNPEVLSKLDDSTLNTVIQQIGSKKTAEALEGLDTDEAIEVLDDLDTQVQKELLSKMDESRKKINSRVFKLSRRFCW